MEKTLQITAKLQPYKDKETGERKTFTVFCVNVNGIELQVKPVDRTSQALLEQYFGLNRAD